MNAGRIDQLVRGLEEGACDERAEALRAICPCRNHVRDVAVWRTVFHAAHHRGTRIRDRALHAVATLMRRARTSPRWRDVLRDLVAELDGVLQDREACRRLRQQIQHGAAARGGLTAAAHCKRLRRLLDITSPQEMAAWINGLAGVPGGRGVRPDHPGLVRLWRWHVRRVTFQPQRRTGPDEFLKKVRQWLPAHAPGATLVVNTLDFNRRRKVEPARPSPPDDFAEQRRERIFRDLESPSPQRRARGLKRLAAADIPDLSGWCVVFLEDESVLVRVAALKALSRSDRVEGDLVEPFVASDDVRERAAAIAALAWHGGHAEPHWYERGLKDPSACVRL